MAPSLPPIGFINGLVGKVPSRNNVADVIWVQGLLNRWLKSQSKPSIGLDGDSGPGTVALIVEFQRDAVKLKETDGRVVPGQPTAQHLLNQRQQSGLKITIGKNFLTADKGQALDKTLYARVLRFCQCVIDLDLADKDIRLNQGVRARETAHKWSTSWNIRKRRVPLAALQTLKDGKDLDGNLWYDPQWAAELKKGLKGEIDKASLKKLWDKIDENASTYYSSNAIAAEGYPQSSPRVKPNVHRALSNHIDGNAMDVAIPWKAGVKVFGGKIIKGATSEGAVNRLVRAFGLSRPVKSERWHFQLPAHESRGFIAADNLSVGDPSGEEGPQSEE